MAILAERLFDNISGCFAGERVTRLSWCLLAWFSSVFLANDAAAQLAVPDSLVWEVDPAVLNDWSPSQVWTVDSTEVAAASVLNHLQERGYLYARVDSVVATEGIAPRTIVLHLTPGEMVVVRTLRLLGVRPDDEPLLRGVLATREGAALNPEVLRADVDRLLDHYERQGLGMAQVRVRTDLVTGEGLDVIIEVEEGRNITLSGLRLEGAARTSGRFAARMIGLPISEPIDRLDPLVIRGQLEATELFDGVDEPVVVLNPDGTVELRVGVRERSPGTFDLVLGYVPAQQTGGSGSLVGNGVIVLRSPFGQGRLFSLRLVRDPGLTSTLDVRAADPLFMGLPLRLEGGFNGYGQDSTYSRQRFMVGGGFRVAPGLEILATASRENVAPGSAGARLVEGRPLVAAGGATFGGIGLRYHRLDRPFNPRRGMWAEATVERGIKRRSFRDDTQTGGETPNLDQQRFHTNVRGYLPLGTRLGLVAGVDASVLISDAYDEADLFRIGGASTLRGYEENALLGNIVGRGLAELRYLLDATSHAFAFFDLGFVQRPEVRLRGGTLPEESRLLPGYGFGIQYDTPLGVVLLSYGLNPDDRLNQGKIHIGLSFGL